MKPRRSSVEVESASAICRSQAPLLMLGSAPRSERAMRAVRRPTRAAHGDIIAALRARDRLAYAYLMSRHLDFALRFLPEEPASDT